MTSPPWSSRRERRRSTSCRRRWRNSSSAPSRCPACAGGRPSAVEWIDALETLAGALVECRVGIAHWHLAGLPECPWCRIEAATGVPLFSTAVSDATASLFDLPAFWQQLIAIEHPGPAPDITAQAKKPRLSPVARRLLFRRGWHGTIALLLAVIPAGLSFSVDLPPLGRSFFFAGGGRALWCSCG